MASPTAFRHIAAAALCAALFSMSTTASADPAKAILIDAIKHGSASGILTGPQADAWKRKTGSSDPILVEAKVIKRFSQPDCARLAVKMTQAKIPKKDGSTGPLEVGWGMNLCTDGLPPMESVDAAKGQKPTVETNKVNRE